MIQSYDCRNYSAKEIILLLFDLFPELQNNRKMRRRVYLGATNDVERRAREHKIPVDKIIFCAQTANQRVAAKVEELAKELGFNIGNVDHGGNGTNSHSIYIYAYVVTRKTKQ